MNANRSNRGNGNRAGVVLLIVLVLIVAMSVVVYSFSRRMLTELSVAQATGQATQQQRLAESAVESLFVYDRSTLAKLSAPPLVGTLSPNIAATNVALTERKRTGQFAILQRCPTAGAAPIWGLENQSAKLNLNALTPDRYTRQQVIQKLSRYRDLSQTTAGEIASLLGFADNNERLVDPLVPQPARAEQRIRSWEQLLSVTGVTADRLFGEDLNLNGHLDPWEDDGGNRPPDDNGDGKLRQGWAAHWTLTAGESNYQENGNIKINLNQQDLVSLFDQLLEFATPEEARFVVAWRLTTATYTDDLEGNQGPTKAEITQRRKQTVADRLRAQLNAEPNSSTIQPSVTSTGETNQLGNATGKRSTTRAGIDLRRPPAQQLSSLLDLASCQLQLYIDGKDTVLVSPFANDPQSLRRWLPLWESKTTVHEGAWFGGRIQIMQASQSTLETIDGISPSMAQAIISRRDRIARQSLQGDASSATIGWLVETGILSTAQLRKVGDEITMGGGLYRGVAVGQLDNTRTASPIWFELDCRGPRRVLRHRLDMELLDANLRLPISQ